MTQSSSGMAGAGKQLNPLFLGKLYASESTAAVGGIVFQTTRR